MNGDVLSNPFLGARCLQNFCKIITARQLYLQFAVFGTLSISCFPLVALISFPPVSCDTKKQTTAKSVSILNLRIQKKP